jgi:S1-C subfamily serine protease
VAPRLLVEHLSGSRAGTRRELEATPRLVLGRHPRCQITFDPHADRTVSARHAEIRGEAGTFTVVDLESANGTFVDGAPIQRLPLVVDQPVELELGRGGPRVRLTLSAGDAVPETLIGVVRGPTTRPRGWLLAVAIAVVLVTAGALLVRNARRAAVAEAELAEVREALDRQARDQRIRAELERERAKEADEPGVRVATENAQAVYLIAAETNAGEDRAVCTAFALAPTYLGTNAHCVEAMQTASDRGEKVVAVRNKTGARVDVVGWVRSTEYQPGKLSLDVGLVEVGAPVPKVVALAPPERLTQLGSGQAVFLFGFPEVVADARAPVATVLDGVIGRVTTLTGEPDSEHGLLVQHNVATSHGASGSPLFDRRGQVIAINVGQYRDASGVAPGVSVSIRIDGLLPLLEERR